MKNLTICLPDGTFDGIVHMYSSRSAFSAIRIPRSDFSLYKDELSKIGLYMLLIGSDAVYVGQSGQPLFERIPNTHTGSIDSEWHTLVAFPCNNRLNDNELRFIENALCEYAHKHCPRCVTSSPSKGNCTAKYRKDHYRLVPMEIDACNEYVEDIEFYISHLRDTNFTHNKPDMLQKHNTQPTVIPPAVEHPTVCNTRETETFFFSNPARGAHGSAIIEIHLGHTKKRKAILKAGSQVSIDVCPSAPNVAALREQYETEGKMRGRILLEDIPFDSQSGAGAFLNGTSFDGNGQWKTSSDIKLKALLE